MLNRQLRGDLKMLCCASDSLAQLVKEVHRGDFEEISFCDIACFVLSVYHNYNVNETAGGDANLCCCCFAQEVLKVYKNNVNERNGV